MALDSQRGSMPRMETFHYHRSLPKQLFIGGTFFLGGVFFALNFWLPLFTTLTIATNDGWTWTDAPKYRTIIAGIIAWLPLVFAVISAFLKRYAKSAETFEESRAHHLMIIQLKGLILILFVTVPALGNSRKGIPDSKRRFETWRCWLFCWRNLWWCIGWYWRV